VQKQKPSNNKTQQILELFFLSKVVSNNSFILYNIQNFLNTKHAFTLKIEVGNGELRLRRGRSREFMRYVGRTGILDGQEL